METKDVKAATELSVDVTTAKKMLRMISLARSTVSMGAARVLGSTYSGSRNIYDALGYSQNVHFDDFMKKYRRDPMGKAIINRVANTVFRDGFRIANNNREKNPSKFQEESNELISKLKLVKVFRRLEHLALLGRYAGLMIGFNDTKKPEDFRKPVRSKASVMYVRPFSEASLKIDTVVKDTSNERFGLPDLYNLRIVDDVFDIGGDVTGGSNPITSRSIHIHHTRVVHVAYDCLESEVFGIPFMESVYNTLDNIEKVAGGSAEMFWRGARPGYHGSIMDGNRFSKDIEEQLDEELSEFEDNLKRFLITQGVEISALETQVSSPKEHFEVLVALASAATGIPLRVLLGSERGELASQEDRDNWFEWIEARRSEYAEPEMVRPFFDRLVEVGSMTAPHEEYRCLWSDLASSSEKRRVDIGRVRSESLRNYTQNPGTDDVISVEEFCVHFLGFDKEIVDRIVQRFEDNGGAINRFPPMTRAPGSSSGTPNPNSDGA